MADAKEGEGEAKQDGTEECQSICLCCGVQAVPRYFPL